MKTSKGSFRFRRSFLILCSILILLLINNVNGLVHAAPLPAPPKQGLSYDAQINKSFDPISIVAGQVSRLSVTIYNPNIFQLDNAA